MIIGVPKEIKDQENRIALTPAGAKELVRRGHKVVVESKGASGIDIDDNAYRQAGAEIGANAAEVYERADMIVKVKEPLESEWPMIKPEHVLFTYFHFASSEKLTRAMIDRKCACIAYETVTGRGGHPLLTPMSEIAGRLSVQQGAKYLEKPMGGRGTLLGGVPGVKAARVAIIGGGVVGTNAAKIAAGMGARVTILDIDLERLRYLDDVMPKNVQTLYCNEYNVQEQIQRVDVVIGGVYISGARAPKIIRREHLAMMPRGSVLVDVAIDQGGCFETARATTHSNPTYEVEGIIHYCVANMPGAVARTSTFALTNATLPYVVKLADRGYQNALREDENLMNGLNVIGGRVCCKGVAEAFNLELDSVESVLDESALGAGSRNVSGVWDRGAGV